MGGRGASSSINLTGKALERYKNEHGGFTPQQIKEQTEYFNRMRNRNNQREITSSTYERAQRRTQRNINAWFGRGM